MLSLAIHFLIIFQSSSVFSGNITESDESVIQESQNASNSTLHLKNVEQGFQQKSLVHKRIVRRIPKTIQDENHQQASLKTVRTLTQGQKVGQRTVITSTDVNNDQNLTRVQIKNVIGGAIQKLPLEKKMTISAQPGSSNKISLTTSQRQVAYQDQAPRVNISILHHILKVHYKMHFMVLQNTHLTSSLVCRQRVSNVSSVERFFCQAAYF